VKELLRTTLLAFRIVKLELAVLFEALRRVTLELRSFEVDFRSVILDERFTASSERKPKELDNALLLAFLQVKELDTALLPDLRKVIELYSVLYADLRMVKLELIFLDSVTWNDDDTCVRLDLRRVIEQARYPMLGRDT